MSTSQLLLLPGLSPATPSLQNTSPHVQVKVKVSHTVVSDSAIPWTVTCPAPLLMEFSRQGSTGVGCHFLLQGIFPSNPALLHCRQILYQLNHQSRCFPCAKPSQLPPQSKLLQAAYHRPCLECISALSLTFILQHPAQMSSPPQGVGVESPLQHILLK